MSTVQIFILTFAIFSAGYLLNMFYITVLYHRALTHGAVQLTPVSMALVKHTGNWVTGIDPKAWACMHRLHHLHSDTELDPHSPVQYGVMGVAMGQLRSYQRILKRLIMKHPATTDLVKDIPFNVSFLNQKKWWTLPYFLHIGIGTGIALASGYWFIGLAYFVGIMSHPVQGWMVNSLAHRYGYRNFDTDDNSRNNTWVAIAAFGEGFQNNHHANPANANFAHKASEVDLGYSMCKIAFSVNLLKPNP